MLHHIKLKIVMFFAIFGASSTAQALSNDQWNQFECTVQKLRKITDELVDITSKKPYPVFVGDLKKVLDMLQCLAEIKPCGKHTVVDTAFKAMVADLHQYLEKVYNVLVNPKFKIAGWIMAKLTLKGCDPFSTMVQRMDEHLTKITNFAAQCQPMLVNNITSFQTTIVIPLKKDLLPKTLNDYTKGLSHRLSCK